LPPDELKFEAKNGQKYLYIFYVFSPACVFGWFPFKGNSSQEALQFLSIGME